MKIIKVNLLILFLSLLTFSCGNQSNQKNIVDKVDVASKKLNEKIRSFKKVVTLDHHRMAKVEGVYTPPAITTIFSNLSINTKLIEVNQLVGLDLPYKVLCYSEPDTTEVSIAYTSSEFILNRHKLMEKDLEAYNLIMNKVISAFPEEMISETDVDGVTKDYGIVKIQSDFKFETTVQNLRDIVMAQGDTKWFADIDYQKEAKSFDIKLRPTSLLMFGGSAPGGKAMMTSPKIGLDAFCQKLLVYENEAGEVWIAYNDIVAFAELYYGESTKPQQMINQRLKMTFTKAVKN